jgi:hypothetical protein
MLWIIVPIKKLFGSQSISNFNKIKGNKEVEDLYLASLTMYAREMNLLSERIQKRMPIKKSLLFEQELEILSKIEEFLEKKLYNQNREIENILDILDQYRECKDFNGVKVSNCLYELLEMNEMKIRERNDSKAINMWNNDFKMSYRRYSHINQFKEDLNEFRAQLKMLVFDCDDFDAYFRHVQYEVLDLHTFNEKILKNLYFREKNKVKRVRDQLEDARKQLEGLNIGAGKKLESKNHIQDSNQKLCKEEQPAGFKYKSRGKANAKSPIYMDPKGGLYTRDNKGIRHYINPDPFKPINGY